jgi:hypothetical protein
MEQASDVKRLFSWLKTEDLRYREFAASREVKDAVATWPALHEAAKESGHPAEAAAPAGAAVARERIARETMPMPPVAAEAIRAEPPVTVPPQPLAGSRLMSALGRRIQATRHEPQPKSEEPTHPAAAPAAPPRAEQGAAADTTMPMAPPAGSGPESGARERAPVRPTAPAERAQGGRFFGGAYGGEERGGSRRGHSLDAVFSRLSGGRSRPLPDPRDRSRGSPGLGSVFNRLR